VCCEFCDAEEAVAVAAGRATGGIDEGPVFNLVSHAYECMDDCMHGLDVA
jgi:hypothetical protein